MTIRNWPRAERPREKLLSKGINSLSDAEVLAVVFGSGIAGCDAVELARRALALHGSICGLVDLSHNDFTAMSGLGDAKFVALHAGIEIGRRALRDKMVSSSPITNATAAKAYLVAELGTRSREAFCALFLDNRHRVIAFEILFVGTIDSATVHPREVVTRVIELRAAAVIFAHNHPSGVSEPSAADASLTRVLTQALKLIDVRVLDHFVVARQEITSFADRGLLE
jgi:DNA repair protein RadC